MTDDGHDGEGQHDERDVTMPAEPGAGFVVIETSSFLAVSKLSSMATRAWAKRFNAKAGRMPTEGQTADYSAIADGIADGTVNKVDISITAKTFLGAVQWSIYWYRPKRKDDDAIRSELARKMVRPLIEGLRIR
jgi:hypothetical protein